MSQLIPKNKMRQGTNTTITQFAQLQLTWSPGTPIGTLTEKVLKVDFQTYALYNLKVSIS